MDESVASNDSPLIKRVRKPQKLAEIRTKLDYSGLGLLSAQDGIVPHNHTDPFKKNGGDTAEEEALMDTLSNHILPNNTTIVGGCIHVV